MRAGEIGPQLQGLAVGRYRVCQPALGFERVAEVVECLGVVGLDGDGLADEVGRLAGIALLELDNAEKM